MKRIFMVKPDKSCATKTGHFYLSLTDSHWNSVKWNPTMMVSIVTSQVRQFTECFFHQSGLFKIFPDTRYGMDGFFSFRFEIQLVRKKPKSKKPRSHETISESNWILSGGRGMGCREWLIGLLYRVLTQWSVKTAKCLSDSEFIENYWSWSAPIRHLPFTIFIKLPAQFW